MFHRRLRQSYNCWTWAGANQGQLPCNRGSRYLTTYAIEIKKPPWYRSRPAQVQYSCSRWLLSHTVTSLLRFIGTSQERALRHGPSLRLLVVTIYHHFPLDSVHPSLWLDVTNSREIQKYLRTYDYLSINRVPNAA
jgi:hypothetical protein